MTIENSEYQDEAGKINGLKNIQNDYAWNNTERTPDIKFFLRTVRKIILVHSEIELLSTKMLFTKKK